MWSKVNSWMISNSHVQKYSRVAIAIFSNWEPPFTDKSDSVTHGLLEHSGMSIFTTECLFLVTVAVKTGFMGPSGIPTVHWVTLKIPQTLIRAIYRAHMLKIKHSTFQKAILGTQTSPSYLQRRLVYLSTRQYQDLMTS